MFVTVDYFHIFSLMVVVAVNCLVTNFLCKISYFVFKITKTLIQIWKNVRASK